MEEPNLGTKKLKEDYKKNDNDKGFLEKIKDTFSNWDGWLSNLWNNKKKNDLPETQDNSKTFNSTTISTKIDSLEMNVN